MTRNMVRIGDVCTVVSGSTPKTSVAEYWDGDIKWITPAELTEDTFYLHDSVRHITELGKEKTGLTYMPCGTVILSSRAPIGKTAIIACEMCCNQGFKNLICSDKIFNEYLYFFLSAKTKYLNSLGRGATFKEISKAIVENIMIPLPCIEQQKQIAARFAQIDDLIKLRRGQLQQLDQLVKSRFIELFGEVETNDKGFVMKRMDECCKFVGGAQPDKSHFEYEKTDDNIRLIQIRDYKSDRFVTYIPKLLARKTCTASDIMIGRYGPPIFQILGGIEGAYNVALMKAMPTAEFNAEYFRYFLKSEKLLHYLESFSQRTAGQDGIQIDKLNAYPCFVPPMDLQNQFAAFVEQTDKLKFAVQNAADLQIMLILNLANYHWKHRASVSDKGVKL